MKIRSYFEFPNTLLENNRLKRMEYSYSNDRFNNVTRIKEYDWGTSPNAGTLIRQIDRTYLTSQNGYCYTNLNALSGCSSSGVSSDYNKIIHIRRLMLNETVKNGSLQQEAFTEMEYDNYSPDGNHAPVVMNAGMAAYNGTRFTPYVAQFQPRGNLTKARSWIAGSTYAEAFSQYDNAGNVVKTKDPRGFTTTVSYADNYGNGSNPDVGSTGPNGATFARATKVTNALLQEGKTQYDYTRGAPTGFKDANGVITKGEYDLLDRIVRVTAAPGQPEETKTEMSYPTASANEMRTSSQLDGSRWLSSRTQLDGFGRPVLTSQSEDGLHYTTANFMIHSRAIYDGLGRVVMATNPYRGAGGATTDGWSRMAYDLAGRVVEVATFSGGPGQEPPPYPQTNGNWTGSVVTTYNGEVTTVRDQMGKQRRSTVDGLGRLTKIEELFESGSLYATTTYGYDARGNLKTVSQNQGGQNRTFSYDGLSRLTSAFNPESETINYTYDPNSNLKTRTDARTITTEYFYDHLNRVTKRTYTDGTPTVNYNYDTATRGVGRLASAETVGVSTYNYTEYDRLGRVTQYNQVTGGQPYFMSSSYNKAGLMVSETYPSQQKVIQSEYDGAGRLAGVKNQATGLFYAGGGASDATNRMQYTAHGGVSQMKLGNGLWEHMNYNSRLQPTQIGLGTSGTNSTTLQLDYTYGTTNNNGNVQTQEIKIGTTTIKQNYAYDHLNRLQSASESVGAATKWTQSYGYDVYGNRTSLVNSGPEGGLLPTQSTPGVNAANNRLTGFGYDNAGNVSSDGQGNTFTYDGENRQLTHNNGASGLTQYVYDGDGRRVKRQNGANITIFVYNAGGQLVAEYATNAATGPIETSYLTSDHLGSTRVVTAQDGSVKTRRDYCPFGEEIPSTISGRSGVTGYGANDGIRQQFTSKERDDESGLDYFGARYYSSTQGRFTSPDEPLIDQSVDHPQSWNLYTYVRNNPLRYIDPNGKRTEWYDKNGRFLGADDEVTINRDNGTLTTKDGRVYNLDELQVIEQIKAGPEDDTEELKELQSDSGAGALVLAAGGVALVDSPAPGPADVVALGILAGAAIVALNQPSDSILLSQNKHNKEVIAGLIAAAAEHLEKLQSNPPNDPNRDKWKREIKAFLDRAKNIARRLVGKSRAEAEKVIESIEKGAAEQ